MQEVIYSKRGLINKMNVVVYVLFHVTMAVWSFSFLGNVGTVANECAGAYVDACLAGAGLGGTIGFTFLAGIWFVFGTMGAIIVYMTRPKVIGYKNLGGDNQ